MTQYCAQRSSHHNVGWEHEHTRSLWNRRSPKSRVASLEMGMVMEKLIRRFNTSPSSKKKLSGSAWPEVVSAQMDAPSATSFGVSLADLYEKETLGVPMVVRQLCAFLCAVGGLECEGVFRVNGNSRVVEQLRARAEELQHAANGESAKTTTFLDELQRQNDVHAAASLLKMFLRELPGGLVPSAITKEVLAVNLRPAICTLFQNLTFLCSLD
ncbi:unnamed protein product [Schistocephalus solidus]|uniref:Rho-GAP domain-containing protein n=1 Tax=Schistocephalus solidus TaxID=70667 RepID=A0A3P7CCR0_SCHSO|nr:unnamed protein product [Schistocephalus solidus]